VGRPCGSRGSLTALLDTNVVVRHLTGDPPAQAARATRLLASGTRLFLTDVVFAECVFVLRSYYEQPSTVVVRAMASLLGVQSITVLDRPLLLRALALYAATPLDFADAYLAATAELSGVGAIASFDRDFDAIPSIERVAP
jgi:predicted nucleic acid-binding protein